MPVSKCENGKWKIGKDGDCIYSSKEKAENVFKKLLEKGIIDKKELKTSDLDLLELNMNRVYDSLVKIYLSFLP